jgi:hypothetical protein
MITTQLNRSSRTQHGVEKKENPGLPNKRGHAHQENVCPSTHQIATKSNHESSSNLKYRDLFVRLLRCRIDLLHRFECPGTRVSFDSLTILQQKHGG